MENNFNINSAAWRCVLLKRNEDAQKGNDEKSETFADAVKKKEKEIAAKTDIYDVNKDKEALDELSAEEYKTYIYFKISQLQRQSPQKLQRKNFVLADISDEGFAAMQADPQYESWVLGKIKESLYYNNTWEKRDGTNYF
ncbi:MAG: hypothetical protein K2G04_03845, partial [Oscillospiraceae bacterium]|nr:hypothetical protein [Oscillospiraceae bacterium]